MENPIKYKPITVFRINIDNLKSGWETISLFFNATPITFVASYIGPEPLSSLIEAVEALDEEYISGSNESQYFIDWICEPGCMNISLRRNILGNQLSLEIKVSETESLNDSSVRQWNFVMNYSLFREAVIDTALSALNKYGICGFTYNWDTEGRNIVPIASLLSIMGLKPYFDKDEGSFKSDFTKEIDVLSSLISRNRIPL